MLYQELQPVDTFTIKLSHPFSDYDRQLLTLFYQPLIGPEAMSLFMSLWAEAEREKEKEFNHYYLMNLLTMPLVKVFEARISLEAIGLMRTFCKQEGEERTFCYELLQPLDAKSFFEDPLLSTFLFSKIGEQPYRSLRARFTVEDEMDEQYKEISRTFLDVFKPIRFSASERLEEGGQLIGRNDSPGIPFANFDFDFNLFRAGLSEQMVPTSSLASVPKELIEKLAFLYSLTPLDMQKVVMMALDGNLKLPEERLRKAAVDYYKLNISQNVPTVEKVFKTVEPEKKVEPTSREDELLNYLENTSPREMLRHLNGKEPFPVDVQLAERLINTHGLSVGVVNVLLQYMILRNDGKITNNFAERIASHWSNKKVSTAKMAMELSRTEHDQYMKWLNEGKQKPARRKPTREEKVPEWFYKKEETEQQEPEKETDPSIDEKRRQLLEKLDAMRSGVK
ncbi:DnaD domain protein [Sporosarcina sp. ACRSL]|uniref:replication initiation and membrane attachment family protein n=1 Tax=Sporosarcina sp. ACRSL TaxID=2918215 RepID=UPI001EF4E8B3|nr:DnaD domain protein [Sporosarcina sp. ACRSL]MCG7346052.1 DnaD domain protein [Sporosarcina sp. ACRSL]